jgi:hypothetical protein
MNEYKDTFTITFGDQAENHVGMQKIGKASKNGYGYYEVKKIYKILRKTYKAELVKLHLFTEVDCDKSCVLIIRNGIDFANEMYEEQKKLNYDKKALMKGKVVNKHARHNLCFDEKEQEPDYENGKGRIVSYSQLPFLNKFRNKLEDLFGCKDLVAEGNFYYDIKKCGIGFHGDSERKKVIAIRLGASATLSMVSSGAGG